MKRFLFVAGLTYLVLILGLATVSGDLLALTLPFIVYLALAVAFGPQDVRVKASRTVSADRVVQGTRATVRLSITNQGSLLEQVRVEDRVPRRLAIVDGSATALTALPPGETLNLEYTVEASRGFHDFRTIQVTASDQLGLYSRQVEVQASTPFRVMPEPVRVRRLAIRPLRTRGTTGPVPSRTGGSGIDFFGVREYQVGDPRRWINWRVSARHPQSLFSNEFEQERIADVGLILDARSRSQVLIPGDSLFEHSVLATASLAQRFLADGNRVGLLVYGRLLDWTFPGYGKVQRERILQALSRAETGESQIFERLDYLPTRYFPAQSQIVLVSPLASDDVPMLVRLRARGYQVLVIRPDPVAFEARALPPKPAVNLATRVLRAEHLLVLRRLQQAGIQVVDWEVGRPFDEALHTSLSRVPHWFRAVGVDQ